MSSSHPLRVLIIGSLPGEGWLLAHLASVVPPADVDITRALDQVDWSAHYDLVLTQPAHTEEVYQHWPRTLICEPVVEHDDTLRLKSFKLHRAALIHLIEHQLNATISIPAPVGAKQSSQLEILREISQVLGSKSTVSSKLQHVIQVAIQLMDAAGALAFLLDKEHQHNDIVATSQANSHMIGRRVAVSSNRDWTTGTRKPANRSHAIGRRAGRRNS